MIILADQRFIEASFDNEEEIETVVYKNAEYIFGPDTILIPKSMIRSADGFGTIPDGFAIDFAERRWFIVEAELGSHSVWGHIAPQVSKQVVAAMQPASRKRLAELFLNKIRENAELISRIEELGVAEIDIARVLANILETSPIIGIPIDHIPNDLREWAQTLRNEVKLWRVRKLVKFEDRSAVLYEIPDEYRPEFISNPGNGEKREIASFDVGIADLLNAGLLRSGQRLTMTYGPRGGSRIIYTAEVTPSGELLADGRLFTSPSYAALMFIQKAGSQRKTVNGWTSWKVDDGQTLADIRDILLSKQQLR